MNEPGHLDLFAGGFEKGEAAVYDRECEVGLGVVRAELHGTCRGVESFRTDLLFLRGRFGVEHQLRLLLGNAVEDIWIVRLLFVREEIDFQCGAIAVRLVLLVASRDEVAHALRRRRLHKGEQGDCNEEPHFSKR